MFFALGFVPEIINSENFMVSCFPLIYRTVWASVTMFTTLINKEQNYWALIGWERGHFFLIKGIFSNQERAWLPVNDWLIRCIILPFIDKQVIPWDLVLLRINCTWVFKIFKILKTLVQLILNSTWPHVITYTKPLFYTPQSFFLSSCSNCR